MAGEPRAAAASTSRPAGAPAQVYAGNGTSAVAARYLAVRDDVDRRLKEYRRVLAETEQRRERAVKTLRRAGYLR